MDRINMSAAPAPVNTTSSVLRSPLFGVATFDLVCGDWPADQLLPGIPMDARLAAGSQVSEATIGKVPGRFLGGRGWVGLTGPWSQGLAAVDLSADLVAAWPTCQVCVTGRASPALDIDIEDAALADEIQKLAASVLEQSLVYVRTRAGTGRRLIPFIPAFGVVQRWQIRFTLPETGAAVHTVEVIGEGFQWLAFGDHKSGSAYEWPEGVPTYTEMPFLIREDSEELRAAVVAWIEKRGGAFVTKSRTALPGERRQTDDLEPLLSIESLDRLLEAVPDTPDTVAGWDDGVSLLASMRYVLGSSGRECPAVVATWAAAYPGSDLDWAPTRWRSFDGGVEVTEGRLLQWITQHAPKQLADELSAEIGLGAARRAFGETPVGFEGRPGDGGTLGSHALDGEILPQAMAEADDTEPEERLRRLIEQACKQVAYFEPEGSWVFVRERLTYSVAAFNDSELGQRISAADYAVRMATWDGDGARPKPVTAHRLLLHEAHARARIVKARTYAYGDPALVRLDLGGVELPYLNTALPGPLKPWAGVVTDETVAPYLAHAEQLIEDPIERARILDWIAWTAQHPREKIRWAPVLKGPQGGGKDTLFSPLREAVGAFNFQEISPGKLAEKFTSFYEKRVVLVSEMSNSDRHDIYERMKSAITGSAAGLLWVERKGIDPYPVLDRLAWVILTNHDDAIALAADDRRFYVVETSALVQPPEYFDGLYDWLLTQDGYRKVVAWLMQRDTSSISPHRSPGTTAAKEEMRWASMPAFARWLAEQLGGDAGPWSGRTVVSVSEIQQWADANSHLMPVKIAARYHPKQVREGLLAAGWAEYPRRLNLGGRAEYRQLRRVYCAQKELTCAPLEVMKARLRSEMARGSGQSPFDQVVDTGNTGGLHQ